MSKITELISKMYAFLDSADQSSTPEMREISLRFAALCREVNEDLEHADMFLKKGLVIDALKFDKELHPSLLSRAATLNIKRFEEWSQLCHLYENWESPQPINLAIVRRMHEAYRSTEMLAPLLEKWRAIMRDGSTEEKLDILRNIHKLDPANKAWAGNLAKLEQVRLEELYDEAKQAILDKDYVGLEKIFLELSSPDLNAAPDDKVMEKITAVLHEYQKNQLAAQTRRLLGEIADAYSEQNYETLQTLFRRWEELESDPDFEQPPEAASQIEDTRRWMRQIQEERERQEEFDRTLAALIEHLDSEGPIHEIERLYGTLQRLDLPLPDFLTERVRSAREKADLKSARIHRRRLILGVLAIIAVIGITAYLIAWIQEEKAYKDVRRQMENALNARQYKTVLDQYEHLSSSTSPLAERPAILKLRDDAKKQTEELAKLASDYTMTLKAAEVFLTPQGVEAKRLEELIRHAEKLTTRLSLTAAQTAALTHLKIRRDELLQQLAREREARFRRQMEELEERLSNFRKKLLLNADLAKLSGELADFRREFKQITSPEAVRGIDRQYQELFRKRLDFTLNALETTLKNLVAEKNYRIRLETPSSFLDYMDALDHLETRQPSLYPQYANAVSMTNSWRRFSDGIFSKKELNDPAELKNIYSKVAAERGVDPNYSDLARFVPPEVSGASGQNPCPALTSMIEELNSTILSKEYDLYEIILEDAVGNRYHFFTDRPPEFENPRKNSKYPRSMTLMVSTRPGNAIPLKLEISGMYGKIFFRRAGELKEILLPDSFVRLVNGNLLSRTIPKAHHFTFLKNACHSIRNAPSPAQAELAILTALKELRNRKNMNAYMRMNSAKRLLGMLKLTSGLNNATVDALLAKLNAADAPEWSWMNPREEVDRSAEAAAMRKAVDQLPVEELERTIRFQRAFYEEALSRILRPAAIVLTKGKEQIIPFRDSTISGELWSITRIPGGEFSIRIFARWNPENGIFRKDKSADQPVHGMVLFTPDDRMETLAVFQKLTQSFSSSGNPMQPTDYPLRWPANFVEEQ